VFRIDFSAEPGSVLVFQWISWYLGLYLLGLLICFIVYIVPKQQVHNFISQFLFLDIYSNLVSLQTENIQEIYIRKKKKRSRTNPSMQFDSRFIEKEVCGGFLDTESLE